MLLRIAMTRLSSPADAEDVVQEAHEDLEVEKSADGVGNQTFLIQEAN